jgi:hypothetical protein
MPLSKICYVPKYGYTGFNMNEMGSKNVLFKVNQRSEKAQSAIDFGLAVSGE